jgi:hypothetical protein
MYEKECLIRKKQKFDYSPCLCIAVKASEIKQAIGRKKIFIRTEDGKKIDPCDWRKLASLKILPGSRIIVFSKDEKYKVEVNELTSFITALEPDSIKVMKIDRIKRYLDREEK